MKSFVRFIRFCSGAGGVVSAMFMVLIVLLIMVEIVMRSFFGVSTLITAEYSAYFFVAVVLLGLAVAMRDGAHIRITLLLHPLGAGAERIMEIVGHLLGLALCTFALYHSILMVYDTYALGMTADTISETPIWIPQISVPLGLGLLDLQLLSGLLERVFRVEASS